VDFSKKTVYNEDILFWKKPENGRG